MKASNSVNYRNRFNRQIWLTERRKDIRAYYHRQAIVHGGIPREPMWCQIPFSSVWLVKSIGTPGFHGWYVVCGDHPTDLVGMGTLEGTAEILEYFASKWWRAAQLLLDGEDYPDFHIERIEDRPKIGELVKDRSDKFSQLAQSLR